MKKLLLSLLLLTVSHYAADAQLIKTVAGNTAYDYGEGNEALFSILNGPWGIVTDDEGNFYFSQGNIISKVDAQGLIYRFAGAGSAGYSGDGHKARQTELNRPAGIAFDHKGNLFIADSRNGVIRKVRKSDNMMLTAYKGFNNPVDLFFDKNDVLYVSDGGHGSVVRIDTHGVATTIIGGLGGGTTWGGGGGGYGGGSSGSEEVRFSGVTVDDNGNIYLTDRIDNIIRKISPDGERSVIAGTGVRGKTGNCPATSAMLSEPTI